MTWLSGDCAVAGLSWKSPIAQAHERFPKGNIYLRMRDQIGTIFNDPMFTPLFPIRGQPAESPWRLALITVMQFVEGLSDRQAADAVRSRIDWKYALSLELTDPGFDASVLCEFRTRLIDGDAGSGRGSFSADFGLHGRV